MHPIKRHREGPIETGYFKRRRTYSSDSETEEREPPGLIRTVSSYIKQSILDSFIFQRVADMFSPKKNQEIPPEKEVIEISDDPDEVNGDSVCAEHAVTDASLLNTKFGREMRRLRHGRLNCHSDRFSKRSSFIKSPPTRFESSKNSEPDDDVIVLPVPVIKSAKCHSKKVFKLSNSMLANGEKSIPHRRKLGRRTETPFKKYEFTVKESIRLAERDQYKRLLQQYTSTPSISATSSLHSSGNSSPLSLHSENGTTNATFNCKNSVLKKTKLNLSDSHQLSLHLQSLSKKYQKPERSQNSPPVKTTPIVIDVEYSSSSRSQSVNDEVQVLSSESETEEVSKMKHPPIFVSRKNVLQGQIKKFFSQEWTQQVKKELDEMSSHLKPLIEIAKSETEILRKKRNEKSLVLRDALQSRLREAKYTYHELEREEEEEEEKAEEAFIELSEEMEEKIEEALIPTPPDQVLVEGFNLTISRRDIETLADLNWLNDEVINFYFNLLVDRGKNDNYPSVYAFNTFFYPKLMTSGHPALKRWTRKVDIFAHDFIVIPIHLGMHWCLAIINFKEKKICYYDSLGNNNHDCLKALKQYLCDESNDKKKKPFNTTDWTLSTPKDIPQQMNGSDCGMFACIYAEYITREVKITFTQEDMPYFRRRMVYEILTKQLL